MKPVDTWLHRAEKLIMTRLDSRQYIKPALTLVRELLEEESAWTKGTFARDSTGEPCPPTSRDARSYCLLGAVKSAAFTLSVGLDELPSFEEGITLNTAMYLNSLLPGTSFVKYNDYTYTTHADIITFLDKAIALCKASS